MKQKSITKNTLVYILKVLSSMIFPLITFPYISRVLSPEGIGKYNFATAYISYFSLAAAMGITAYAIREGARIRDNRERFNCFASEVFTLNIISTILTYVVLVLTVFLIPKLRDYRMVILLLSGSILLTTIGTEWVCSVYEDYVFITIRSVIFQIVSMILMFLFVKEAQDVEKYAVITVIANAGANLTNWNYVRKYFNHKLSFNKKVWRHLKPVLILFSSTIASQIYVNSDTVMLGFLKNDYEVGIYAAATKVYNLVRTVLASFVTVLSPRMVYLYSKEDKTGYTQWMKMCLEGFFAVIVACAVGVFCVSEEIIILLSGEKFMEAVSSLQILAVALIFSLLGSFMANEALLVGKQEKKILLATSMGAAINIAANFFMIPVYGHLGAAITTLISEIIVFGIQLYYSLKIVRIEKWTGNFVKAVVSAVSFYFICGFWKKLSIALVWKLAGSIVSCVVVYFLCMVLLRHSLAVLMIAKIKQKK